MSSSGSDAGASPASLGDGVSTPPPTLAVSRVTVPRDVAPCSEVIVTNYVWDSICSKLDSAGTCGGPYRRKVRQQIVDGNGGSGGRERKSERRQQAIDVMISYRVHLKLWF
ncbi:hypothetical protein GWI33_007372 [Rhynchophorus ferrugineus]|uniref:Uncharacterized protein n=1 Tax=Rhynchophorus ferrugineus TaxID=354439 RepID=A0A834MD41_RHYFE|nr:hypothetical protein GWI33_007372 [Rhynchophorus ferrugineus]